MIRTPAQWDAVMSPPRLELIYALHVGGPLSIAELAQRVDRPADALYHHVRKLVAGGVVVEIGTRRAGKQTEAVFDFVADKLLFDFDARSGRNSDKWKRLGTMILRMAERSFAAAVDQAGLTLAGPHKDLWSRMDTAWLSPADLARVNEHFYAVEAILAGCRARAARPPDARLFNLALFVMPVVRTRHARVPDPAPRPARRTQRAAPRRSARATRAAGATA